MNKKKLNKKKGFTLIELIVVIAILGILAAIAIPRFAGIQGNANKKAVISNLKTLNNAISTFAADNNKDLTAVTQADVVGSGKLIDVIPAGPSTVEYSIEDTGYAKATVPSGTNIPGLAVGSYKLDSAGNLATY